MALKGIIVNTSWAESDQSGVFGSTFNVYNSYINALNHTNVGLVTIYEVDPVTLQLGLEITQSAKISGLTADASGDLIFAVDDSAPVFLQSVNGRGQAGHKILPDVIGIELVESSSSSWSSQSSLSFDEFLFDSSSSSSSQEFSSYSSSSTEVSETSSSSSSSAETLIIGFDDLIPGGSGFGDVPVSYRNLNWTTSGAGDVGIVSQYGLVNSGFDPVIPQNSVPNAMFINTTSNPNIATISSTVPFNLVSLDVVSAVIGGVVVGSLQVNIEGFDQDNNSIGVTSLDLTGQYVNHVVNINQVLKLEIEFIDSGLSGNGRIGFIDNMEIKYRTDTSSSSSSST